VSLYYAPRLRATTSAAGRPDNAAAIWLADLVAQCPHRIGGAVHVEAGHRQIAVTEEIAHKKGVSGC
jgi:hypothetical protein